MSAAGYNPMRWNCDSDGCFNVVKRPKIEVFKDCFPGRISFGDIDGIVEKGGMALLLEWKPAPVALNAGQRIMYENLSKNGKVTALVLAGDAQTMQVTHRAFFWSGKKSEWSPATLDDAKEFCRRWAVWAQGIADWAKEYDAAEKTHWRDEARAHEGGA